MKKRIFSIFLALVMVLGLVPTPAFATETWTEISTKEALLEAFTNGGYYKLTDDIYLNDNTEISNSVNLDLNGKELGFEYRTIKITNGCTLTVSDSGDNGSIKQIYIQDGGSLTLNSGTIEDGTIYISGGTFTMNGGSLKTRVDNRSFFYLNGGKIDTGNSQAIYNTGTMYAGGGTVSSTVNDGVTSGFGGKIISGEGAAKTVFNSKVQIYSGGTVEDGIYNQEVTVYADIGYDAGKITGGIFNGDVENLGTISGGDFSGTVTNNGLVIGGTFKNISNSGIVYATADVTGNIIYDRTAGNVITHKNGTDKYAEQFVKTDTTATEPTAPTETGYSFGGWYSDENFTTKYDFTTPVIADITLYAKWTENSDYVVYYETDEGTKIAPKSCVKWTHKVLEGKKDPTKEGYKFMGWTYGEVDVDKNTTYADLAVDDTVMSLTLMAKWKDIVNPVISGVENGKTYCEAQTVTVTDENLNTVTVNGYTVTHQFVLSPAEGAQTIIATDKDGNEATMTVTVNDGHTWGNWSSNNDDTHSRYCTIEDCDGEETADCSGGTATCKDKAICVVCLEPYGEEDPNNHTGFLGEWQMNETQHWKIYSCCDAQSELGKHTDSDKNHICDTCGYDKIGEHADADNDHKCDYGCTTLIGECLDTNHDHQCDYGCDKYFGEHADKDNDHNCDYCGQELSKHSGGTATCKDKAICVVCLEPYGEEDPNNHANLKEFPANDATAAEEGNIEYWYCDGCEKYFSDENAENEIKLNDTAIAKLAPSIIKGDGQSITEGEKKALAFTSDAAFDDFIRVEVDGKAIDESNYTVKSGSTVVTLNADYVATLSAGEHTLGIVSQSGTATAKFTVNKKAEEVTTTTTDKPTTADETKSPKTGDDSNIVLWLALFFVSGGAVTAITIASKKRKYNS